MVAVGLLKTIEKTGSPGKTRTCDIWINTPPFQPQLIQVNAYKISINLNSDPVHVDCLLSFRDRKVVKLVTF